MALLFSLSSCESGGHFVMRISYVSERRSSLSVLFWCKRPVVIIQCVVVAWNLQSSAFGFNNAGNY